jgi:tetratricopeptide (TPR) repeat protein
MPFRLNDLRDRVAQQQDSQTVTRQIVKETEEALAVLPFIQEGHKHETEGSYPQALKSYQRAHHLVPQNLYIMRHIAKTLASMGHYDRAVKWFTQIIAEDPNAKHFRRLADALACLGQFKPAELCYTVASQLAPKDAATYLEWGDVLLTCGDAKGAVDKYRQAEMLDGCNNALYTMRIVDAYLEQEEFAEAQNLLSTVLIRDPEHREAKRKRLQILRRESAQSIALLDPPIVAGITQKCQEILYTKANILGPVAASN